MASFHPHPDDDSQSTFPVAPMTTEDTTDAYSSTDFMSPVAPPPIIRDIYKGTIDIQRPFGTHQFGQLAISSVKTHPPVFQQRKRGEPSSRPGTSTATHDHGFAGGKVAPSSGPIRVRQGLRTLSHSTSSRDIRYRRRDPHEVSQVGQVNPQSYNAAKSIVSTEQEQDRHYSHRGYQQMQDKAQPPASVAASVSTSGMQSSLADVIPATPHFPYQSDPNMGPSASALSEWDGQGRVSLHAGSSDATNSGVNMNTGTSHILQRADSLLETSARGEHMTPFQHATNSTTYPLAHQDAPSFPLLSANHFLQNPSFPSTQTHFDTREPVPSLLAYHGTFTDQTSQPTSGPFPAEASNESGPPPKTETPSSSTFPEGNLHHEQSEPFLSMRSPPVHNSAAPAPSPLSFVHTSESDWPRLSVDMSSPSTSQEPQESPESVVRPIRNTSNEVKSDRDRLFSFLRKEGDIYVCLYEQNGVACNKLILRECRALDHVRLHTGDKPYICKGW
jgi:hypothetical protein